MSCRKEGAVIIFVCSSYANSRRLNISSISSFGISVPRNLLMRSGSNGISFNGAKGSFTSTIPPTTSPHPSSSINWHALLIASSAFLGSSPFSKMPEASVLSPTLLEDFLIFAPLNVAASNKTVCTSSVIFEFSPPIIPARPISFSASQIISISESSFLTCPSSVWNVSPSFARRTMILLPATFFKS